MRYANALFFSGANFARQLSFQSVATGAGVEASKRMMRKPTCR
jgi:hypothetical protein